MAQISEFQPQWTSPPGQTIADLLSSRSVSRAELANSLELSASFVDRLIDGHEPITLGLARRLQGTLGGSAAFWMTRAQQYRHDVARLRDAGLTWLRELPLEDMSNFGWIPADPPEGFEVEILLRYFSVPSVPVFRTEYTSVLREAAFRTSPTFASSTGAVAAWLRQGQLLADKLECAPWSPDLCRAQLGEVRSLTRIRDPKLFIPKLRVALAKSGVAVVVLQAPTGCRASGAARWLSDEKALVLLSARHLTDDHFWFTFYHECAHLLLHRDARLFLDEEDDAGSTMEKEANALALDMLLPKETREVLLRGRYDTKSVLRIASQVGIAPGIVVAQLQRAKSIPQDYFNRLKRRFVWENGELVSREMP